MRRRVWAVLPALALLAAACQAPSTGTQSPDSPKGVRHGTDAGQPGGSPGFTIEVTEDMCAQIAACSGRLSKRAPVYIWDAPIDDIARTAADIGTDFIPGVAQAKTAYDAYERIQNGEDPVDVLMAAGGDAALGVIPGFRTGKKLGKAADKAEDVADAAGDVADAAGDVAQTVRQARPGKAFRPQDKREVIDANRQKYGGKTRCEFCGVETSPAQKSRRGVTPPTNETQVDHIQARANGGSGTPDNAQVLCRTCNRKKWDE